MNNTRIAILTLSDPSTVYGGVETYIHHLQTIFNDAEVFAGYKLLQRSRPLPFLRGVQAAAAACRAFLQRHQEKKFDLVFSNGMSGWMLGQEIGIPRVNVFHGTNAGLSRAIPLGKYPAYWAYARFVTGQFERISGLRANVCVAVSKSVREDATQYYHVDSCVINNAVDTSLFQPIDRSEARVRLSLPQDSPIVLFVGRWSGMSGYLKGALTIQETAKERPNWVFVCVLGENVPPSITCPHNNILFRFNIAPELMPLYYSAADVLLFPTFYEGCAYVPLEAMACNLPVVLSPVGMFKYENPKNAGLVVHNNNSQSYLKAIDQIINSDIPLNPRLFIEKRYTLEHFKQDYIKLVQGIVNN